MLPRGRNEGLTIPRWDRDRMPLDWLLVPANCGFIPAAPLALVRADG